MSRGQSSKRQSSGSSSGNSSAQQRNVVSQGSSGSNELPTCPLCQKKHRVSVVWELEHVMGVAKKGTRLEIVQRGIEFRELGHQHLPQSSSLQLRGEIINHDKVGLFALVPGNTSASTSVVSVPLEYELSVSLPSRDTPCYAPESTIHVRCVNDVPMYVDLMPLEMHDFDVILGMDWLSSYRALIDCELKRVVFHSFAHSGLIFEGVGVVPPPYLISSMKASRLIRKGSQAFLCSVIDTQVSPPSLEDIHVVREFFRYFSR
ncbi:hypothetical protein Acr_00g0021670 [Actinidia rufa]|uniref:Uncharacterized protein n=1 Tax=Actinidia rufa TaxID=165716 RepID=A0A7J0DCY9_9ERIC|nr:hypothetical protein Acr_00g0021670 [Actinidia rufa]